MADLTSTRSPRVAEVRKLHDRRHRAERGAFVVEGPQAVSAAVGHRVDDLYVAHDSVERFSDLIAQAHAVGAQVHTASEAVLAAMTETRQPQGIVAVCPLITVSMATALTEATHRALRCVVVLDRANDPGNAGTVIRTADALGVGAVILTEGSVDPHNGKVVRSTAGSIFHVPIKKLSLSSSPRASRCCAG